LGNNTSLLLVSKNYKKKEERMEGERGSSKGRFPWD